MTFRRLSRPVREHRSRIWYIFRFVVSENVSARENYNGTHTRLLPKSTVLGNDTGPPGDSPMPRPPYHPFST